MKTLLLLSLLLAPVAHAAEPTLYDFDARFTDQAGHTVTLDQVGKGHPVLISMFYGSCPMACPMLITRIRRLEKSLPEAARRDLRVMLITFDPKRDDVPALKRLVTTHQVDSARWSFLRTDPGTVRELAAVLGIQYHELADGSFQHTSVITAVGRDGSFRAKMDGLDQPDAPVLSALQTTGH